MGKSIKRREMLLGAAAVLGSGLGVTSLSSQSEKKNSAEIVLTHHTRNEELKEPEKALEEVKIENPSAGIGEGERPFDRDEETWAKIVKRFYELYMPIRVEGKGEPDPSLFLKGPLDPNLISLESHFTFKQQEIDEDLRCFQVESLLCEAADLLERAMTHRTQWQEKAEKATSLRLEILEYLINDAIHQEEIEAGKYTLPYKRSVAESNALAVRKKGAHDASILIQSALDKNFSIDAMNKQSGNVQLLALLPYYPSHETPYVNNALNINWNFKPGKFADHAKSAAFEQSFFDMHNRRYALYTKKYKHDMERDVAKEKDESLNHQKEWSKKEIEFKRRRAQAAREIGDLKLRLAIEPGGSLNFADQMDQIRLQFERDFRSALARIKVAYEGLRLIYGYKKEIPESLALQLNIPRVERSVRQDSYSLLDGGSAWVNDALQWLNSASLRDQEYTVSISIRQTIGDKKWYEGRKVGKWKFQINERAFPDQKNVRLRGINVYVSGSRDTGVWMSRIELPKRSFSYHKHGRVVDLDQTSIPPIRIGRVSGRNTLYRPEIAGSSLIYNASPFGKWKVFLNEKSTAGNVLDSDEEIELVDDLVLDLEVVVKS